MKSISSGEGGGQPRLCADQLLNVPVQNILRSEEYLLTFQSSSEVVCIFCSVLIFVMIVCGKSVEMYKSLF